MSSSIRLTELADRIGGAIEGDGNIEIHGIAGLFEAVEGEISFFANPKYASALANTKASAVIVRESWEGPIPCAAVRVRDPDKAMAMATEALGTLCHPVVEPGVHPSAVVSAAARVSPDASIGPFCVVESGAMIGAGTVLSAGCHVGKDAVIGDSCRLHAYAVVRESVRIGTRVVIHEGAVVGSDGFGNYRENGTWKRIPHIGIVEVGDDAEIGANVTVDRARFGSTVIGKGVKIDNLVQVAHNVKIGDHTVMAAQVGIAGSSTVGNRVMLGGQAGLAGHVEVGDGARIGAQAGVTKNVAPDTYVTGYPAMPHRKAAESQAHLMRLKVWKEKVKKLEERIEALERLLPRK
jgi:UDP-3-O-[3-hydroxymyristoyl] glucosamine N-acyltransferase